MNVTHRLRIVAAATVAGALLALSGAASATPTTPAPNAARLGYVKGRADAAIQQRQVTLTADAKLVGSATELASSDQMTFLTAITSDQAALGMLKTTIDNDATLAQAISDAQSIVTGYRIYVLVDPKIHETIATDRIAAAGPLFAALATNLQSRITSSGAKAAPGAQAALNDMNAKVSAAEAAAAPVVREVLPLVPSGYPGNKATLVSARHALETARQDLRLARADAATVVADLH